MPDNPNLLFIWTDQQSAPTMGAYGNDRIDTPNLDALAAESAVFEKTYVTQSVCTPSRASILTGKYPHALGLTENNVSLPADAKCFPELDGFDDYATGYIGKWHLGDEIFAQHGFDEWISVEDQYWPFYSDDRPADAHSTYHEFLVENGFEPDITEPNGRERFTRHYCATLPEEYSKPAYMAREVRRFIQDHQDEPFILHVMFLEPHQPYTSPRDDQYSIDDVDLPPNFDHNGLDDQPRKVRLSRAALNAGLFSPPPDLLSAPPTETEWRQLISNYWGLVSLVDTYVGSILKAVSDHSLTDRTITVYTSDHGDMLGSHQLLSKMTQFEEAVRVPLLMRIPGVAEDGRKVSRPMSQIDVVPTLLDAMGKPIPDYLQGQSWLPFLADGQELEEENVFIEWNGPHAIGIEARHPLSARPWNPEPPRPYPRPDHLELWTKMLTDEGVDDVSEQVIMRDLNTPIRTIVTPDGWKLNFRQNGEHELFDLDADPHEMEDLADDPAHTERVDELAEEIFEWQKRTRDPIYL